MNSRESTSFRVALIGNPNTGKSTLFGVLAGVHQHVGNYPGVTVEKKTGRMDHAGRRYELIDLPGLYSLAPRSRDEAVTVDVLLGRADDAPPVDAVVCIVDAGNLTRAFYLLSQVLELGLPTVVAVNMLDVAERHGISIDVARLRSQLPVAMVPIQANRRVGIDELKTALAEVSTKPATQRPDNRSMEQGATAGLSSSAFENTPENTAGQASSGTQKPRIPLLQRPDSSPFPEAFEAEVSRLAARLADASTSDDPNDSLPRCLLRRLLLDTNGVMAKTLLGGKAPAFAPEIEAARARLAAADCQTPGIETTARYAWARRVLEGVVVEPRRYAATPTDRADRVLTHRLVGTIVFALLMVVVFQSVFVLGRLGEEAIGAATTDVGRWVEAQMTEGALRSLAVDGVIAGVGGVLRFLPQILILFLLIAVLEDCGYMARAAFLMDRLMVRVGLSGRSFIPMLSCFACAVPGVMAARVIENERDRLTTILVAPLMTCSARLPVYALLIGAFIPARFWLGGLVGLQGLTLASLYLLGIITAVVAALVLKRTLLRGGTPMLLMELPSYKWPSPRMVLFRVAQRGWQFLRCAGTLVLTVSVVVWAALYYPHDTQSVEGPLRPARDALEARLAELEPDDASRVEVVAEMDRIDRQIAGAYQRQSFLGRAGRFIEPVVRPLGWDWRVGCAVIASLPAREIVVATLAVIYDAGDAEDIESVEGKTRFQAKLNEATWDDSDPPRKVFTLPVALSMMVFFALCAQCAATLAVIRQETGSWRWPAFSFTYMTVLAYLGALATYQLGTWIGL